MINLNIITKQIKENKNNNQWSDSYTKCIETGYHNFLSIKCYNKGLKPHNDVKKYWEQHVLNTQHYKKYCKVYFGAFINHDPQFEDKNNGISLKLIPIISSNVSIRLIILNDQTKKNNKRLTYLKFANQDISILKKKICLITEHCRDISIYTMDDIKNDCDVVKEINKNSEITNFDSDLVAILR